MIYSPATTRLISRTGLMLPANAEFRATFDWQRDANDAYIPAAMTWLTRTGKFRASIDFPAALAQRLGYPDAPEKCIAICSAVTAGDTIEPAAYVNQINWRDNAWMIARCDKRDAVINLHNASVPHQLTRWFTMTHNQFQNLDLFEIDKTGGRPDFSTMSDKRIQRLASKWTDATCYGYKPEMAAQYAGYLTDMKPFMKNK